ncbi:putative GNAT superfamily acetyltransferase [Scopulibacillus daqui]|uniref:GNAT superfamily acetyltransferase n=1 Tax=Scopulibacillus daqui TaxID=1469162 RepID=A0ABS2Q154_9BACL|nr:GNAT family N-acetyltransferase [Scopulibacillus daqui]MBM7646036.1 putative GNAT superfamily acetyltransferase [Scopulibacillus daqui]
MKFISHEDNVGNEHVLKGIKSLHGKIFQTDISDLSKIMNDKKRLFVCAATDNEKVSGYKVGYERKEKQYYSWIGGIHHDYRRKGIGSHLMRIQHEWCQCHGYETIQTNVLNKIRYRGII